jgi:hypothetical protein
MSFGWRGKRRSGLPLCASLHLPLAYVNKPKELVAEVAEGNCMEGHDIVGPGYQPGCIILRVGNLAD